MARQTPSRHSGGFSLLEMLIAVAFTGILMAGMAQVFKSSLGAFTTSGEILSASRRNRASTDLLYDDLNSAGMYLMELGMPPGFSTANPGFYILPNQAVAGASADGPATADQLFFYLDQPLAFEGTLLDPSGAKANDQKVELGVSSSIADAIVTAADLTFTVNCYTPSYAALVQPGMYLFFKDSGVSSQIQSASASGSNVSIVLSQGTTGGKIYGRGFGDAAGPKKHIMGSGVQFFAAEQMVRYSIKMKALDPSQPGGIPCLVRDQGAYSRASFVADPALESVITENVSGFKAYLSANAGQTWAGYGAGYTGLSGGWYNGILSELKTQLVTSGRQDFNTFKNNDDNWFRRLPLLVRLDVTTRSAVKRMEYNQNAPTDLTSASAIPTYKDVTQSLVIVPRHFGLPVQ